MSKFQIALLVIFGFFIILAVIVFSLYRGATSEQAEVTVWGSIPAGEFNIWLNNAGINQDNQLIFRYEEKPAESLSADFTEALASGRGPDLLLLPQSEFYRNKNKLAAIPYESISERQFKETFAEGGEIFLSPEGIYALPLYIDPLVLYYNRDLLSAAGYVKPLSFWDEIYNEAAKLTKRDEAGNIIQSAIALGEWRNIANAKDILSLLLLQAGTSITSISAGGLRSELANNFGLPVTPAERALDFYTQFANPSKTYYSWSRMMPEAQTGFASGDAAYYLGLASELRELRKKSSTLNFSVASVPQSRVGGRVIPLGHVYGLALSRGTRNPESSLQAALKIVSKAVASEFSKVFSLPPARRDLLKEMPKDAIGSVFYEVAIQARAWVDPEPEATAILFSDMVLGVTSGRLRVNEAIRAGSRQLDSLIK